MKTALTPKQETFCLAYIEIGNASEAYRQAYNAMNMKPETISVKASELIKNGKVAVRINELQTTHRERHNVTVDTITDMLVEDRSLARENGQGGAAVSASMGLAKLLGYLKDKVEHSGSVDLSSSSEWVGLQADILSALTPYPDARQAVLDALEAHDG